MSLPFFTSLFNKLTSRWPLLLYAATWTTLLTLTVAVASFWPEVAFVWAISPSSSFSQECDTDSSVRVPLDLPGELLCLPTHIFKRSKIDLIIPPVFAAVVVAGSAWIVRALGLFESDDSAWFRFRPSDLYKIEIRRLRFEEFLTTNVGNWFDSNLYFFTPNIVH